MEKLFLTHPEYIVELHHLKRGWLSFRNFWKEGHIEKAGLVIVNYKVGVFRGFLI